MCSVRGLFSWRELGAHAGDLWAFFGRRIREGDKEQCVLRRIWWGAGWVFQGKGYFQSELELVGERITMAARPLPISQLEAADSPTPSPYLKGLLS